MIKLMVNIGATWCTFQSQAPLPPYNNNNNNKNNKKHPEKIYIFQKKHVFFYFWMELSSPKPKRFLIYLKKTLFLYFWMELSNSKLEKQNKNHPEKISCFSKKHFPTFQDDCWSGIKTKNIIHTLGWLLIYSGMTAD